MLQGVWRAFVHQRRERRKRAYQIFLANLAESPTVWSIHANGSIRSSQGECPIVEVNQRVTKSKCWRAASGSTFIVYALAGRLGLSRHQALVIMHAADNRIRFNAKMRVRNDLLTALEKAKKRMDATAEGVLIAECRWEKVGV